MFDPWTMVHLGTGFMFGWLRIHPFLSILLFAAFEIWESGQRASSGGNGEGVFEHESYFNIVGDMSANWIGFCWGRRCA